MCVCVCVFRPVAMTLTLAMTLPLFPSLIQATVVVKYFSQFGLFPWTTKHYAGIHREKPFALPNIIGVEEQDGSVLCDLLQLLALFFHRSTTKVRPPREGGCDLRLHPPHLLVMSKRGGLAEARVPVPALQTGKGSPLPRTSQQQRLMIKFREPGSASSRMAARFPAGVCFLSSEVLNHLV